ncbi:hypothetical protein GCM10023319_19850 [Nocardia iowensis]
MPEVVDGLFSLPSLFDDCATPVCWSYGMGVESVFGRAFRTHATSDPGLADDPAADEAREAASGRKRLR